MAKMVKVLMDARSWVNEQLDIADLDRLPGGEVEMLGVIPHGTATGPSVAIGVEVEGRVVVAQMTMKTFLAAAQMFAGAFPEVLEGKAVFAASGDHATVMMIPDGHVGVIGIVAEPKADPDETVN